MSSVSYAQSARVQKLSTVVFGQKHRLATMAAIAQGDGLVNPTDLAIELGFPAQSAVQIPLRDLAEAGLITRQPGKARSIELAIHPAHLPPLISRYDQPVKTSVQSY